MLSLDPHTNFFGSFVDAEMEVAFLRESVDSLESVLSEAAARPSSQHAPLNAALAAIAGDREYLYTELLPAVVHETHAISCVVFLERQCRDYVQALAAAISSSLTLNDLSGSVLQRFRTYCEKVAGLPLGLSVQDWQTVSGLVTLRNALVHVSGLVESSRDRREIEAFVRRHRTPEIVHGRLRFSRATSELFLSTLGHFVNAVYEAALNRFPPEA
jgi:hypothetical protein